MQSALLRILGAVTILSACLVIAFRDRLLQQVLILAAPVFSSDGEVSPVGIQNLQWSLCSVALIAGVTGSALWGLSTLQKPVQSWFVEIFSDEQRDLLDRRRFLTLGIVGISILAGVVASLALGNPDQTELEDTWVENLQLILLGVSVGFLVPAAFRICGEGFRYARWVGTAYGGCAIGLIFVFLEEISWGQRIFGWETPAVWGTVNAQKETNLHNLLNEFFLPLYLAFGICFVGVTVLSILEKSTRKEATWLTRLLPHPTFFFSAIVFAAFNVIPVLGAVLPWGEFQEFLVYVCLALYSWEKYQSVKA